MPPAKNEYELVRVFFNVGDIRKVEKALRQHFPFDKFISFPTMGPKRITTYDFQRLNKELDKYCELAIDTYRPRVFLMLGPLLEEPTNTLLLDRFIEQNSQRYSIKVIGSSVTTIQNNVITLPYRNKESALPVLEARDYDVGKIINGVLIVTLFLSLYKMYKLFSHSTQPAKQRNLKKEKQRI